MRTIPGHDRRVRSTDSDLQSTEGYGADRTPRGDEPLILPIANLPVFSYADK